MVLNAWAVFCMLLFFSWNDFSHTKNQPYARGSLLKLLKTTPLQVHHELTCSHYYIEDEGEEADQDKNMGGVCCKGQGWRVGEYHKGGKNQEYEESGGGVFPGCDGEEEVTISIQRWADERDKFLSSCVF